MSAIIRPSNNTTHSEVREKEKKSICFCGAHYHSFFWMRERKILSRNWKSNFCFWRCRDGGNMYRKLVRVLRVGRLDDWRLREHDFKFVRNANGWRRWDFKSQVQRSGKLFPLFLCEHPYIIRICIIYDLSGRNGILYQAVYYTAVYYTNLGAYIILMVYYTDWAHGGILYKNIRVRNGGILY